jgi:hypothetical protein
VRKAQEQYRSWGCSHALDWVSFWCLWEQIGYRQASNLALPPDEAIHHLPCHRDIRRQTFTQGPDPATCR